MRYWRGKTHTGRDGITPDNDRHDKIQAGYGPARQSRCKSRGNLRFAFLVLLAFFLFGIVITTNHQAEGHPGSPSPLTQSSIQDIQIPPDLDNTLFETEEGNLSNGSGEFFFIGRTSNGLIRRGLVHFDIQGSIPAGSTITDVRLTLSMSRTISGMHNTALHRVIASWGEGTSDANGEEGRGTTANPNDATWLHRFHNEISWSTPGGDYATYPSAEHSIADVGLYTWESTRALVSDVQQWLDSPQTNYGWLLRGNESENGSAKRFDSRENPVLANRPALTVKYTSGTGLDTTDRIARHILGIDTDSTGLDKNVDGVVDVADIVSSILDDTHKAPIIESHPVYRTYPGLPVELTINAFDPEGTNLDFHALDLPNNASLDPETGLFNWIPDSGQLGPVYARFTVTDHGLPERSSYGVLIFQILHPEACVDSLCSPQTGCEFNLKPISEDCCPDIPEIRIAEPEAPCPEGRLLHVGRNVRGFGRLQNCDLLHVESFGQGGSNVTLHFETRCVDNTQPVMISTRLETADEMLFDRVQEHALQLRPDGFSQALSLTFQINSDVDDFTLENREALLTSVLTDSNGTTVGKKLRLKLTLNAPLDLPNPNQLVAPGGEIGCLACHQPVNPVTQARVGIEDAHPWFPLSCTDCHGGNDQVNAYADAHVFPTTGPLYIKNLAYDQLNQVELDYLRFINPGDFRVASQSCGAASPANDGSGCHQSIVENTPSSVMATYAGHYKLPRFMAGGQDRDPVLAAVDIDDQDYDPLTAPEGTVSSLTALRDPETDDRSDIISAVDIYLSKSCATCHQADFGPNNGAGKYRSSGCTSCHMIYDDDGISRSDDPAILGHFPPHPIKHQLTTAIPTEQCTHCHFQGGRIGLAYRGIREGGFWPPPSHAVPWGKSIYGHDTDYYFTDEDSTNSIDETPPDLHFQAGMSCMDCHIGSDVHGDGYIYASERDQVGIRCEDCHGTVREAITEDLASGFFNNSKGYPMKRIRREGDRILLKLANEDRDLEIPQIFELLEAGNHGRMTQAMGVNQNGFSHTDQMDCYTCHNAWRQTCFGCHVTVNDDFTQLNQTTGQVTQGRISVARDNYSLDFFALGMNDRGKISPLCSSMSVFMSYVKDFQYQYQDKIRQTTEGTKGFGWNPFHHHTVSRIPMNCDSCHPVDSVANPTNEAQLKETWGFGNGQFMATDGDGVTHDLSAFLDSEGNLISTFPHPGTGPVPADIRNRALSTLVVPHPR